MNLHPAFNTRPRQWGCVLLDVRHKFMHFRSLSTSFGFIALACLAGCSGTETIPRVAIHSNSSGIEAGKIEESGPSYLIDGGLDMNGKTIPPDIPSRTTIEVKRAQALHNKQPRYFIPASGRVQVVSVEHYSEYSGASALTKWRNLLNSLEALGTVEQKMLSQTQLSEIPWMNAGRCFHGKLRKRSFPWGDAVLFLTSYVQGNTGGPVNNDIVPFRTDLLS